MPTVGRRVIRRVISGPRPPPGPSRELVERIEHDKERLHHWHEEEARRLREGRGEERRVKVLEHRFDDVEGEASGPITPDEARILESDIAVLEGQISMLEHASAYRELRGQAGPEAAHPRHGPAHRPQAQGARPAQEPRPPPGPGQPGWPHLPPRTGAEGVRQGEPPAAQPGSPRQPSRTGAGHHQAPPLGPSLRHRPGAERAAPPPSAMPRTGLDLRLTPASPARPARDEPPADELEARHVTDEALDRIGSVLDRMDQTMRVWDEASRISPRDVLRSRRTSGEGVPHDRYGLVRRFLHDLVQRGTFGPPAQVTRERMLRALPGIYSGVAKYLKTAPEDARLPPEEEEAVVGEVLAAVARGAGGGQGAAHGRQAR